MAGGRVDDERGDVADLATIGQARAGDPAAIAALWSIYQPQLLRMLRARRAEAPEDVASQVWLEVARRLPAFEGDGGAFRSWVFTIAGRRAIDDARRVQRRREVSAESIGSAEPATDGEPGFEAADSMGHVLGAIGHLEPAAATAVTLRVVHDLPFAEVARLTGRSEGNVRTLVHRSLTRLRNVVDATPDALAADSR